MLNNKSSDLDAQLFQEIQRQFLSQPSVQKFPAHDEQSFEEISESPIKAEDENDDKKASQRWKFCCDKCKKQDKGTGRPKTCVCIVPASQRRIKIGKKGCQTCGCRGCSIEDLQSKKKKKKEASSSSSAESSESSASRSSSSDVKKKKDKKKQKNKKSSSKRKNNKSPVMSDHEDMNNLYRSLISPFFFQKRCWSLVVINESEPPLDWLWRTLKNPFLHFWQTILSHSYFFVWFNPQKLFPTFLHFTTLQLFFLGKSTEDD